MIKTPFKFRDLEKESQEREEAISEQKEMQVLFERLVSAVTEVIPSLIPAPKQGEQGIQGIQGIPGKNGLNGKNGLQGPEGKQGLRGEKGKDGDSITMESVMELLNPEIEKIKREVGKASKAKGGGGGGGSIQSQSVTSSTSISVSSQVILADASGGEITVTLPTVSQAARKEYHVKKVDDSGNSVVVSAGSSTIDGDTTATITSPYTSLRLYSNGTNWFII